MSPACGKIFSKGEGDLCWDTGVSYDWFLRLKLHSPSFTFLGDEFRIYSERSVAPEGINVSIRQRNDSPSLSASVPPLYRQVNLYVKIGINIRNVGRIEEHSTPIHNKSIDIMFSLSDMKIPPRLARISELGPVSIFCELRRLSEEGKPLVLIEKLHSKEVVEVKKDSTPYLTEQEMDSEYKTIEVVEVKKDSNTYLEEDEMDYKYKSEEVVGVKKYSNTNLDDNEMVSEDKIKEVVKVEEVSNTYLDEKEMSSEYKTLKKLQKDLNDLFLNREDCDCILKVQTEEFSAHKNILRVRSPVFKSMFSHDMEEKRSGMVTIDDCDPKTFPDFLKYLYSGSIEHINEQNVCHLYTASDNYQVDELKQECAEFMKSHLSVETFCDFFTSALKHSEEDLIDSATTFFCSNAVKIVEFSKWQIFLQENSAVGNELFLKALSRGRMT